jgi:schlafen family protein
MANAEGSTYPDIVAAEIASLGEDAAKSVIRNWLGKAEDLYLDFKMKDPQYAQATASANDRRNLARAISGFGNSDGGLIVWGVDARKQHGDPDSPDVAVKLVPIDKVSTFHSDLNNLIRDATKPVVPGVVNYKVYEDHGSDRGYVITVIRPGDHAPYRAEYDNNNNFYKRAGSRFYPMEPYDLRDVIFRRSYPKIEVELSYEPAGVLTSSKHVYALVVVLRNRGPISLTAFKLDMYVPSRLLQDSSGVSHTALARFHDLEYRRLSTVRPSREFPMFGLFPEDELSVVGRSSGVRLHYQMTFELFTAPERAADIMFTLYGENMPPLSGSKPVAELIQF